MLGTGHCLTYAESQNGVPVIRADQLSAGAYVLLDVRLSPGSKKISGAIVRSPQEILSSDDLSGVARSARVVVYGDSQTLVGAVALRLRRAGYRASMLAGGLEAWRDAGMPLQDAGPAA